MSNQETLDGIVTECTIALFQAYGLEAVPVPVKHETPLFHLAGVIGFTGESMRGSLLFAVADDALVRSCPAPVHSGRDWIGEMTNQLLGRIKNQLLGYGVEILVSTPVVIRGERISPWRNDSVPLPLSFDTPGGAAHVWFDPELMTGLTLIRNATNDVPNEGDSFFF